MVIKSEDSDYEHNHTSSNLEYAKFNLSHIAVKILKTEPITALFETGSTYSCISQQIFRNFQAKLT